MTLPRSLARAAATALLFAAVQARAQVLRIAPVPAAPLSGLAGVAGAAAPDYAALLARQNAGETLDLRAIPRPGLAYGDARTLTVVQGSGRYERLHAGERMELFVPEGQPLPPGARILERRVPSERAAAANLLSSRGPAGANPEVVGIFTEGKTFMRVSAVREEIAAPMSKAAWDVEQLSAELLARAGTARAKLARRLDSPSFRAFSALERRDILRRMLDSAGR